MDDIAEALHEAAVQCDFPVAARADFRDRVWWVHAAGRGNNSTTRIYEQDAHLAQHYIDLMEEGE